MVQPKVCYRSIERQYRVRVPKEDLADVSWLPTENSNVRVCTGFIGPDRQLQISGVADTTGAAPELFTALEADPPGPHDSNRAWLELARYIAASWTIRCGFEAASERVTFTIHSDLQKLSVLPKTGELIAVFSIGDLVEFWPADRWLNHAASSAKSLRSVTEAALDDLEERSRG
jgi:hypothetical protein